MSDVNIRVSVSIQAYLALKSSTSEGYLIDVRVSLDGFVKLIPKDLQMRHLRPEHVTSVFNAWSKHNGPSTVNKKLGHIRRWLDHASRRRQLKFTPFEMVEGVGRRRALPRQHVRLTAAELVGLLDRADHPRDRFYLALAMNTALRAGEMTSLQVKDVDLTAGVIRIIRHKTMTRDEIPITRDLDIELRQWLTWYSQQVGQLQPDYFLVPKKERPTMLEGGKIIKEGALVPYGQMARNHQLVQRLLAELGYNTLQEGLHTIRRSVARATYEFLLTTEARDEALSIVQSVLGHSTQTITERYIGLERYREKRDAAMKGQAFLSAMVPAGHNVRSLYG